MFFACGSGKPTEFNDITGVFGVQVCPDCHYEVGWEIGLSDSVQLTLLEDSTYDEIHLSFSAFEFISYWGKWSLRNDSVILVPHGELKWKNGKYLRQPIDTSRTNEIACNSLSILRVVDVNSLQSINGCRMEDAILSRNP